MKYFTKVGDAERSFEFKREGSFLVAVSGDRHYRIDVSTVGDGGFSLIVDGECFDCLIDRQQGRSVVQLRGERVVVDVEDERERAAQAVAASKGGGKQVLEAAMPGVVVAVKVAEGDVVEAGQTVAVLEAMKMQNPLQAEAPGVVAKVHCAVGDAVSGGAVLVEIDPPDGEGDAE